jgi:hypothetical protein
LSQTAFFIGYDFFAPGWQWFEPSSNLILSTLLFTIELNALLTHHTHYTPKIILFITHSVYILHGWIYILHLLISRNGWDIESSVYIFFY